MREARVEARLKARLEALGFLVLKLETPGYTGTPDRLILRPTWSPGPPWVLELKRPGGKPRLLQERVMSDWLARGVRVLPFVDTLEGADTTAARLIRQCEIEALKRGAIAL